MVCIVDNVKMCVGLKICDFLCCMWWVDYVIVFLYDIVGNMCDFVYIFKDLVVLFEKISVYEIMVFKM